jgi:hypothetical protein
MHHGYFTDSEVVEAYKCGEHLRDVLTRLLLKMACYVGPYEPAVTPYAGECRVGWVTRDTSPRLLGYRDD